MRRCRTTAVLLALCIGFGRLSAQTAARDARAAIVDFNRALDSATRHMDNVATLALWEDDGVSLLPQTAPIVGKKAIARFLDGVTKQVAGAHMEKFELNCFDIEITGSSASEWCDEHQLVRLARAKTFEGWGRMLLVLHRGADGGWRVRREMWNQAVAPKSAAP